MRRGRGRRNAPAAGPGFAFDSRDLGTSETGVSRFENSRVVCDARELGPSRLRHGVLRESDRFKVAAVVVCVGVLLTCSFCFKVETVNLEESGFDLFHDHFLLIHVAAIQLQSRCCFMVNKSRSVGPPCQTKSGFACAFFKSFNASLILFT